MSPTRAKLFTFGCSYTAGEGLPDKIGKHHLHDLKSEFAWPKVLGRRQNFTVFNKGTGGYSNKAIWKSVLDCDIHKGDIAVIQWTFNERFCIFSRTNETKSFGSWSTSKLAKRYYREIYDDYDLWLDFFRQHDHVSYYLRNLGIQNYHLVIDESLLYKPKWSHAKYLDFDMEAARGIYPAANDGEHPGLEAHEYFADQIYHCIENHRYKIPYVR